MKRTSVKTLDEKALLEKNPTAARIFANNRKKLAGRQPRTHEYSLGLPYAGRVLVSASEAESEKCD
jgi:hypothetical protein